MNVKEKTTGNPWFHLSADPGLQGQGRSRFQGCRPVSEQCSGTGVFFFIGGFASPVEVGISSESSASSRGALRHILPDRRVSCYNKKQEESEEYVKNI